MGAGVPVALMLAVVLPVTAATLVGDTLKSETVGGGAGGAGTLVGCSLPPPQAASAASSAAATSARME